MLLLLGSCENKSKINLQICAPNNQAFGLFATPFRVTVHSFTVLLQMELTDLQFNTHLKIKFTEVAIVMFYQQYVQADQFPGTNDNCPIRKHVPM